MSNLTMVENDDNGTVEINSNFADDSSLSGSVLENACKWHFNGQI